MKTIYDLPYFIKKFQAIPEHLWIMNFYTKNGAHCAYGHCGMDLNVLSNRPTETKALDKIAFENGLNFAKINDYRDDRYQQPTPKQRILAALMDIKSKQDGQKEWKQFRDSDITVTRDGDLRGRKVSTSGKYLRVSYKHKTFRVHEIIYEAFNGLIQSNLEVNHKNGIKTDNRLDNLELCTHSENMKHSYKIGLHKKPIGNKNPNWKGGIYKKGEYQKDWYHANKMGISVIEYREKIIYKTVVIDTAVQKLQKQLTEN